MGAVQWGERTLLVTVDQIVDGVHVDTAAMPLAKVGRKAVTRNLSDVAAMAARPVAAVAAACLPRDFGAQRAEALFEAMRDTAAQYDCPLIGGDIAMWDHPLVLSVTAFADPDGIDPVRRSGAKAGDAIYATGMLGGSLVRVGGRVHHLDFEPRIALARKLARLDGVRIHCMIDLSDGLAKDVGHLCAQPGLCAEISAEALPVSDAAKQASADSGQPAWMHAMGDGEDYELCFCVPEACAARLPAAIDGVAITRIGEMVAPVDVDEIGVRVMLADGTVRTVEELGWEHHG